MGFRPLILLPLVIFAGLGLAFYTGLENGDQPLPSMAEGKAAPPVTVTPLGAGAPPSDATLKAPGVKLVNFWASWCPPCRAEHPVLMKMAAEGVRVAGINMMDKDADATAYLAEEGNPFFALATDPRGRNRIEWGVTNPPETFIIGGDGTVLFRFVGPLVGTDYEDRFVPELEKALKAGG